MESTKLARRIGGYHDAIAAARQEGVTWAQLAACFGANSKYFQAAFVRCVRGGRHKGREQKPLPELMVPVGGGFRPAHSSSNSPTETTEAELKPKKALARVSSGNQKPESEMSAAERIIANLPHI